MKLEGALSWEYCEQFFRAVKRLDNSVLRKLFKQVEKIFKNPNVGKRMFANRKGQQELYVAKSSGYTIPTVKKITRLSFLIFLKDNQ